MAPKHVRLTPKTYVAVDPPSGNLHFLQWPWANVGKNRHNTADTASHHFPFRLVIDAPSTLHEIREPRGRGSYGEITRPIHQANGKAPIDLLSR